MLQGVIVVLALRPPLYAGCRAVGGFYQTHGDVEEEQMRKQAEMSMRKEEAKRKEEEATKGSTIFD